MATATSSRLGLAIVAALVPASAAAIAGWDSGARKADELLAGFFVGHPIPAAEHDGSPIDPAVDEHSREQLREAILADPPEASRQTPTRSNQRATFEAELLAAPSYPRYIEPACEGNPR
jgi:hypothetical protein